MSDRRGRLITPVVVDRAGHVLGALDQRAVDLPWWQEVGPIVDEIPGASVLRLIDVDTDPDGPMGGSVTYLIEIDDPTGLDLRPWDGAIDDHPCRQPWARPGGPAADHRWVGDQVTVTGPPRQHRTWNLSAIWSYPTSAGTVWLKCVPPFFGHEAAVIDLLAGEGVPELIAADRHRILLAELAGHDGHEADEAEQRTILDALVDLQIRASARVDDFLAASVPDLRTPDLSPNLLELIERHAGDHGRRGSILRAMADEVPDRLASADETGPAPTLVHGDAHGGNCRLGADRPLWFDWGDSCIASPLLDLACDRDKSPAVHRHWLSRWEERAPAAADAWEAIRPVARLWQAWVYQRFCDNIEPSERVYHRDDVPACLDAAVDEFVGAGP